MEAHGVFMLKTVVDSRIQGVYIPQQITFNQAIALALKVIRRKRALSQAFIYTKLNIKSSTYNNIDKGHVTVSAENVRNIAKCLNVQVNLVYELAEELYAYSHSQLNYSKPNGLHICG